MPNLNEAQEEAASILARKPAMPTLQDAVAVCKLEQYVTVQRLFELHEILLSRWRERKDNIMAWW